MARKTWMQRLARWHIWLGWLVGVPIVMWTATGLFMVAKPIEEVRGNHLRVEASRDAFPPGTDIRFQTPPDVTHPYPASDPRVREITAIWDDGQTVYTVTMSDGSVWRHGSDSGRIMPVDEHMARAIVKEKIVGGDQVNSVTFFEAKDVPFDFRREVPVWQVALENGAYIYVGRDTGEIEAVRTRWWRWFDFMWGLHIMDLSEREDTSHPILIVFAALGLVGSVFGCVLMFRRRRRRPS